MPRAARPTHAMRPDTPVQTHPDLISPPRRVEVVGIPLAVHGPDRRTTLVGLGAVRRPARKGAMLAGPSDFRVDA